MDEIIGALLTDTYALGVWLLGSNANKMHHGDVLAAAVTDPSLKPPRTVFVESETYFDFEDRRIFAQPIGPATLVFVFDDRSSLGLIRLRVRTAREALERELRSN